MNNSIIFRIFFIILIVAKELNSQQWPIERAKEWYEKQGWLVGCNFIPSSAENTIEMWQEDTFDLPTIDKELGFAEDIGFNVIRVFLHYLVWQQEPLGFKQRLDYFLDIAASHKIKTMFVLFDDCWNPEPHLGKQEPPIPGVHNSRWVQCPGQSQVTNQTLFPVFSNYVQDILTSFNNDERVIIWDLYNEPGNTNHGHETLPLLKNVFAWARDVNTSQPLTSGLWFDDEDFNTFQIENSDIITFHKYSNVYDFLSDYFTIQKKAKGRATFCSEWMARTINSTIETHLSLMKKLNIGAINWGLVSGKTQTIYPWGSPPYSPPPKIWLCDLFNKDGTPFDQTEIKIIKMNTNKN